VALLSLVEAFSFWQMNSIFSRRLFINQKTTSYRLRGICSTLLMRIDLQPELSNFDTGFSLLSHSQFVNRTNSLLSDLVTSGPTRL
jgi:hypothetical protein